MARKRHKHESVIRRTEIADFIPTPIDTLRRRQLRRLHIHRLLDEKKVEIDARAALTFRKHQRTFMMTFEENFAGSELTEEKVRATVNAWIWRTYRGSIGLDKYVVLDGKSRVNFRVA